MESPIRLQNLASSATTTNDPKPIKSAQRVRKVSVVGPSPADSVRPKGRKGSVDFSGPGISPTDSVRPKGKKSSIDSSGLGSAGDNTSIYTISSNEFSEFRYRLPSLSRGYRRPSAASSVENARAMRKKSSIASQGAIYDCARATEAFRKSCSDYSSEVHDTGSVMTDSTSPEFPALFRYDSDLEKYVPDEDWMMGDPDGAKIYLNVGGVRHETYLATLKNVEGTRLAKLAEFHEKALNNGVAREGEYFFDRHPGVFHSILDFYRTNELHYPLDVCGGVVRRELKWWGIDEGCFKTCCVTQFSSFTDNEPLLNRLRSQLESGPAPFGGWISEIAKESDVKVRIWKGLNTPRSSLPAMIYAIFAMVAISTSLIGYCLETVESFQDIENVTCVVDGIAQSRIIHTRLLPLEWIDIGCSIFIILELLVKLIVAPVKLRFIKSFMTIMDILSLIPSIVHTIMFYPHIHCNFALTTFVNITMMFRVLRVFRLVYYLRHYGPFRVMLYSIKSAMNAMVMLVVFMAVSVIFFGALVFYAERVSTHETEHDNDFKDLTAGFWWAIVTLTTVGYGDLIVRTSLGYATGAIAAVSGLVMLAFVVPIISNQFTMLYNFDIAMKNVHQHCQVKRRKRNLSTSFSFREMRRSSFRGGRSRSTERAPRESAGDYAASSKRRKAFPDADHAPTVTNVDVPTSDFEQCLQNSPGSRRRLESNNTSQSQGGYESDQSGLVNPSKFRGRANTADTTPPKYEDVANGEPVTRRQSAGLEYVHSVNNNDSGVENFGTGTGSNGSNEEFDHKKKSRSITWSNTDGDDQERDQLMDDP